MYVVRITKDEYGNIKLSNSKPCRDCVEVIKSSGIKKVIYSTNEGVVICKISKLYSDHVSHGQRFYEMVQPSRI